MMRQPFQAFAVCSTRSYLLRELSTRRFGGALILKKRLGLLTAQKLVRGVSDLASWICLRGFFGSHLSLLK